jgi:acyl transferase domain-containing protein
LWKFRLIKTEPTKKKRASKKKDASPVKKEDKGEDDKQEIDGEGEEGEKRLPKSPWSPSAMKQKDDTNSTNGSASKPKKSRSSKPTSDKKKVAGAGRRGSGNSVRKPRSAYVLFSLAKRHEVKAAMGKDTQLIEVMRHLSEVWKQLPEEEKKPWIEASKEDKERYVRETKELQAIAQASSTETFESPTKDVDEENPKKKNEEKQEKIPGTVPEEKEEEPTPMET